MGDIAVDIFLETLKQLIMSSNSDLIIAKKDQLQSLENEIKYLRGFLKITEKKRNEYLKVMELVMQIRDVVSEAENIVELFVSHAFKADASRELQDQLSLVGLESVKMKIKTLMAIRELQDPLSLVDLESVKMKIKTLMANVKEIYDKNMMADRLTPIKNINRNTKNWTAKVKVLEKWSPRSAQHSPVKYQKLILADAEVKRVTYWIQGKISIVSLDQNFWYMSCSNCRKAISAREETLFDCFQCNGKKVMAKPRVKFEVLLTDSSGSMTATMFENHAEEYFSVNGKTIMKYAAENDQNVVVIFPKLAIENEYLIQLKRREYPSHGARFLHTISTASNQP
ncbi:hypothetical protein RHMOL_Rhmol12G0218400 [Rhododendron molle]|uniref:Uncharacterized protein n=1 Tax=Rhododendron molle TaxID=49168 RepID=A0ACC0LL47_RHOML|nr:hypothetical protein RHMOL_Rhmol12G0218400 [Rhododendron molle]